MIRRCRRRRRRARARARASDSGEQPASGLPTSQNEKDLINPLLRSPPLFLPLGKTFFIPLNGMSCAPANLWKKVTSVSVRLWDKSRNRVEEKIGPFYFCKHYCNLSTSLLFFSSPLSNFFQSDFSDELLTLSTRDSATNTKITRNSARWLVRF